jgi:hypothetical protein
MHAHEIIQISMFPIKDEMSVKSVYCILQITDH